MKSIFLLFISAIALLSINSCTKGGKLETVNGPVYDISGASSGLQMVPADTSSATGNFDGWYDEQLNVLTFTLGWTNLWTGNSKDAITGIGFYSPASAGSNGTLTHIINFSNTNVSGTVNLALAGSLQLSEPQRNDLYAGKCYYVLFTTNYPNGIIRGQLSAIRSH